MAAVASLLSIVFKKKVFLGSLKLGRLKEHGGAKYTNVTK